MTGYKSRGRQCHVFSMHLRQFRILAVSINSPIGSQEYGCYAYALISKLQVMVGLLYVLAAQDDPHSGFKFVISSRSRNACCCSVEPK